MTKRCERCHKPHTELGDLCQTCNKSPERLEALSYVILMAEYHISTVDNKAWVKQAMQYVNVAKKILGEI